MGSDGEIVDFYKLKLLRAQLLEDLREFIPDGYFPEKHQTSTTVEKWPGQFFFEKEIETGTLITKIAIHLFDNSESNKLTRKQTAAADLLRMIGLITASSATLESSKYAASRCGDQYKDERLAFEARALELQKIITGFELYADMALDGYLNSPPETSIKSAPAPALHLVNAEPEPTPAAPEPPAPADDLPADQRTSGGKHWTRDRLKLVADVYREEVRNRGEHGAITRAAARLKRADGETMGRTTLQNCLKEAEKLGIDTGRNASEQRRA